MIEEFFNEPDNVEIIRDQIGAILALELDNQYKMAKERNDAAARDYKVGVYIENDDPLQYLNEGANPFPLVNISLDSATPEGGSSRINRRNMEAEFSLNVYAVGNCDSGEDAQTRASLKAWKTARLVRNILNAERYAYLGMRGIVGSRELESFRSGMPANTKSAIRVRIVQITLKVTYAEGVSVADGEELAVMQVEVKNENGLVVA